MIEEQFVKELQNIVGRNHVSVTQTGVELYSYDASQAMGHPGIVVFPENTQDISAIVKASNKAGVDFIPRGFGTNLSGGTISHTRGLVICLSRFNKILKIVPESRYAVVQPGVTNLEVQEALAGVDQFYAPDPASQKVATLGGNAGENSGGPLCLKYGVTTNHILGMEVVLVNGEIMQFGGPALDPPGLDLRGIMIGSEGSFGIITEVTLRTLPKTESVITMLAVYDSIQDAAQSVSNIISAGIVPNTLEMMDSVVIKAVEAKSPCGYPTDAAAVLIIEVEGMTVGLKEQAEKIEQICMNNQCRAVKTANNQHDRDRLWQGRRGAFGAMARLAPNYLVNDACVLRTDLPEALRQVKKIADKYGRRVGNVFHAGDGNLHPLLLFDSRNPDEVEQVHQAGWEIMEACAKLGGTISGEHGIGREKQEAMKMVFSGDDLNAQQAVKDAFDPGHILNPDKVIPLSKTPGQPLPPEPPTILNRPGGAKAKGVAGVMEKIASAHTGENRLAASGAGVFKNNGAIFKQDFETINTLDMDEVIEFDPANQFITVGAGMSLSRLQEILGEKNQWLPVRPPFFENKSTVGALAAMGVSGPERMLYGAPRDLALGLQYIDSSGRVISTGGKVVKNVAGFDMTRLICGSYGTLGVISEVSWRILIRPELCLATMAQGNPKACLEMAATLMNSKLMPVFICIFPSPDDENNSESSWQIITGFEGLSMVVKHQAEECRNLFDSCQLNHTQVYDYDLIQGCFRENFADINQYPFVLKSGTSAEYLSDVLDINRKVSLCNTWFMDFGCSRIYNGTDSFHPETWRTLNEKILNRYGYIELDKTPESFNTQNESFKTIEQPERQVMLEIKKKLDPDLLFYDGK